MKKVWNVAIYARVSTDKQNQAESIPAQVQSLKNWLLDKSKSDLTAVYNLVEVYEDQGFSGSNFERDSFQKMKEDIEASKINMVLTRDLSRFARNYVVAGYYLEDFFKVQEVRFISVLDNVDTLNDFDDIIPFKNILNEMYIKDISRKVRDALKQRMLRGSSIASKPPYGYAFAEEYVGNVKTINLVPANDETTETVKEIFNLYLEGWGASRIATYLNGKGIAPPSARLNFPMAKFGLWTNNGVKAILTNPKYGGILAQQRYRKLSYKIKKIKPTEESQWIIGAEFEGIISKETFEEVQKLMKKRAKNFRQKNGNIHLFSSVLMCGDCKGSMSHRNKYQGYKCTNSQMGGGRCTSHSVKEAFLKGMVIRDLQEYVDRLVNRDSIYSSAKGKIPKPRNYEEELKKIENEIKKLDSQFEKLYLDKLNEVITQRNFELMTSSIQKKQQELLQKKEEVQERIKMKESNKDFYEIYKKEIDKILKIEYFDRNIVESLIDRIIVTENKDDKTKNIEIYYKFSDN